MMQTILMFVSSAWLALIASTVDTGNIRSAILFKTIPLFLAVGLGLFALARVMGWPV